MPIMPKYYKDHSLKGLHRRFDPILHQKFDEPARKRIKEVLKDFVVDNPDPFEQDLIIVSPTCKYRFLELQVCNQWVNEDFPYKKMYIYERKGKYCKDTLFLTLNKFLTRGYLFDMESVNVENRRRFKKFSREFVYEIPWHRVLYVFINKLDKETIELY